MSKVLWAVIVYILGWGSLYAMPDYSGAWVGHITQESEIALANNYHFSLMLEMDGNNISGNSTIRMWDNLEIFGEMNLTGTCDGAMLQLQETKISQENIYTFAYWCLKALYLTYSVENGKEILRGNWQSDVCSGPGEVYLERPPSA